MLKQNTPGGSLFPYYYKNGELLGLHYGSFFADEAALLALMKAEEDFLSNTHRQLPVWIDFYQSKLTEAVLIEFSRSMIRLQSHITKLGIVGCSFIDKWRFRRLQKKYGFVFAMPVRFFNDPEEAKSWLVSETS